MSRSGKNDRTSIALGSRATESVYSDVEAYYSARVAKYGATPLGVDWSCQATQSLRFVQLLKLCDFSAPFTLNDIGCGYGALAAFLTIRYPEAKIDYLGLDLSRAMVSRARRRFSSPDRRFVVRRASPRIADYSVASGIMNVSCGYSRRDLGGLRCQNIKGDATNPPSWLQCQFLVRRSACQNIRRPPRREPLSYQPRTCGVVIVSATLAVPLKQLITMA